MPKRKLGALEKVDADLYVSSLLIVEDDMTSDTTRRPNLQHKIRRDPLSYKNDFQSQYEQYIAYRDLIKNSPASAPADNIISIRDLIDFISHVADCYPDLTAQFPDDLIDLLTQHHAELEAELREKLVGSLVLLRKKDIIDSAKYDFILLTRCQSSS